MDFSVQKKLADQFLRLHRGPNVVVLANVWDVAGACIVEAAGAKALATSSAAVAFALGYPDGQRISAPEMLDVVSLIAHAVKIPVSADLEAGYSESPKEIEQLTQELLAAGAVGLNLEDGIGNGKLYPLEQQLRKIEAVRSTAERAGIHVVLNARTDVYLDEVGEPAGRFDEVVRRGRAFMKAGADCVFIPGLYEAATIGRAVKEIGAPINILAHIKAPTVKELKKLGVARLSIGSGAGRAAWGLLREISRELLERGTYSFLLDAPSHGEMNKLLSGRRKSAKASRA